MGGDGLPVLVRLRHHDAVHEDARYLDLPRRQGAALELRSQCDPGQWRTYFKFAFVRNPWDRLVSWWAMINRNAALAAQGNQPLNGFQRFIIERARTFDEFLVKCDEEFHDVDGLKWIYRNQIDYLTDWSGVLLVDFVGRYETLERDFHEVVGRLGLPPRRVVTLATHPWAAAISAMASCSSAWSSGNALIATTVRTP